MFPSLTQQSLDDPVVCSKGSSGSRNDFPATVLLTIKLPFYTRTNARTFPTPLIHLPLLLPLTLCPTSSNLGQQGTRVMTLTTLPLSEDEDVQQVMSTSGGPAQEVPHPQSTTRCKRPWGHTLTRNTVRRKMFAINNFREFREWSPFANIIIANFYVRMSTEYAL